jgi:hypothetical protein
MQMKVAGIQPAAQGRASAVGTVKSILEGICCLAGRAPHLCLALALALAGLATLNTSLRGAQIGVQTGAQTQTPLATISVEAKPLGYHIPKDFVGLSLEVSTEGQGVPAFKKAESTSRSSPAQPMEAQYALGHAGAPNAPFFQFMRNLGIGILRLGGNSQDNTCWNKQKAPHPEWCEGTLDAGDLQLFSKAAESGGWHLILGLNLKQNAPEWAREEVIQGVSRDIKPGQISELEIGNEPDLFSRGPTRPRGYSPADQAHEFLAYARAFAQDPVAKQYALAGPATCCGWRNPEDLDTFMDGVKPSGLALVTVHEYPTTTCGGRTVTVGELLAPDLMARFHREAQLLIAAAHQRNLPIALAETNSASCGGMPGVSDAFASTLWGLDWMFSGAEDGFSSINFHMSYRLGGSSYNPIETTGSEDGSHRWHYRNTAEPLYYAMYMFARNAAGDYLLPASIETGANIRAYAVSPCSGCAMKIFAINKDLKAAGKVRVHIAGRVNPASLLFLEAPSLASLASEVKYGGVQFDADGYLPAPKSTEIRPEPGGDYAFALPTASVAMLTLPPAEKEGSHKR